MLPCEGLQFDQANTSPEILLQRGKSLLVSGHQLPAPYLTLCPA